jgi:DNA-binding winged helix-turn-helix (wHTH) protein
MAVGFCENLRFGLFQLSSRERALRRDSVMPPFGSRTLHILPYLAERPGALIAKQKLLDRVWSLKSKELENAHLQFGLLSD